MSKKLTLIVWIIGWSIVAFQQISTTYQTLNHSFNRDKWPPEGFVIVENRSGDKIMISEETDQKFNPKNPSLYSSNGNTKGNVS